MNVLFLSVSAGGGHLKASEVIKDYIQENCVNSKTYIVDVYRYVSPILDKVVIGSYLKTLKNSPKLWGKIYELAEKGDNVGDLSNTLNKIFSYKIKRLVKSFKPDVIVCTHPFPLQMACNLKRSAAIDIPIVTIITDYATHSLWVNDQVDAYVIANENLIPELLDRGVQREKIFPFGIPINKNFFKVRSKNEILKELGLEDKNTFMLMGGSLGMGDIKTIFNNLLMSKNDFQLVVVCGRNLKLKKQLEKLYITSSSQKNVIILGFTDKINELMSISSLIITKPGGLTVTESICMCLPIVIVSPIPGQEEKNALYLLNNGIGIKVDDIEYLERTIYQVFETPLRIKHIKEMSVMLAKPNSAKHTVELLNKLSQKKSTV